MNYFLIKLAFDAPVHFGLPDGGQTLAASQEFLHADSLFSALCHTALQLQGEAGIKRLCQWAEDGELLLSDMLPWQGEDCFLPKPFFMAEGRKDSPASQRKAVKKLKWIAVKDFPAFSKALHGGELPESCGQQPGFGAAGERTRAAIHDGENTVPYQVGIFSFNEDSGLYFICAVNTEEQEKFLMSLIQVLGIGGIGGKVSSGCGKYHVEDSVLLNEYFDRQTQWLYEALTEKKSYSLLLNASLPKDGELDRAIEGASFQLVRRGGYVSSEKHSSRPLKKETQYFFRPGSVFVNRYEGELYRVSRGGSHPVYRYGKALFLGVEL